MTWPQYQRRECSVDGRVVKMARLHAEVLSTLLLHGGQLVSHTDLIEAVWPNPDEEPDWARDIIVHYVHQLRVRIGRGYIETFPGIGYRIRQQADAKRWAYAGGRKRKAA